MSGKEPPSKKSDPLSSLVSAVGAGQARASADTKGQDSFTGEPMPPIERWHPEYCGDIDMEIRADGSWWHEGRAIRREPLVRLFASILRKEEDGAHYLVTPVEKVQIRVALHPLLVVDAEPLQFEGPTTFMLTLNTGGQVPLDAEHPLALEPRAANAPFVQLTRGVTALFSRAAWYRLVEHIADDGTLESGGARFSLS